MTFPIVESEDIVPRTAPWTVTDGYSDVGALAARPNLGWRAKLAASPAQSTFTAGIKPPSPTVNSAAISPTACPQHGQAIVGQSAGAAGSGDFGDDFIGVKQLICTGPGIASSGCGAEDGYTLSTSRPFWEVAIFSVTDGGTFQTFPKPPGGSTSNFESTAATSFLFSTASANPSEEFHTAFPANDFHEG